MGKQKSIFLSFEVLLILVFFIFFVLFMVPKCLKTKTDLQKSTDSTQATIDSLDRIMDSLTIKPNAQEAALKDTTTKKVTAPLTVPADTRTKLYITIDNLKLRKGPSLDSTVVATLPLFEQVYFLGEVTEFTQEISLGYEIVEEPWVKVSTRKGYDGWVFGAGVHYYKKKRGGVME